MTATTPIDPPSTTRAPALNALLASMHGPTTCLATTMTEMVPFPAIATLPDATVLDLHISLSRERPTDHTAADSSPDSVAARVKARYGTAATATEAATFYKTQLDAQSDDVRSVVGGLDGADAHFDAAIGTGRYCARVFDLGRTRTVMVQAESTQRIHAVPFDEVADWHGFSMFESAFADRCEIFTIAAGASTPVHAIYSTEYLFPGMTTRAVRAKVDALLRDHGWAATEAFENSLLFEGTFEGEAHVTGHDGAARLALVGEYPLTTDLLSTPPPEAMAFN